MTPLEEAIRAAAATTAMLLAPAEACMDFIFAPEFLGFAGHFPGAPVLPAVVQIMAARFVVECWKGAPCRLKGVDQAKFLRQISPDEHVRICCRERARTGEAPAHSLRVQAEVRVGAARAALFTLDLEHA